MAKQLSQRADIALSDLSSNGGLLQPEENEQFIRLLTDQPTILRQVRRVPMNGPTMQINKIGLTDDILRPASQDRSASTALAEGRYLAAAKRVAPVTSKVTLETDEVIAELRLPYEVLEDNIERGGMEGTVLALIAERAAGHMEKLLLRGVSGGADADDLLNMADGVLALATSHVVNAAGATPSPTLWNTVKKTMPEKYKGNLAALRLFVGSDTEADYRLAISSRNTALGDAILQGTQPLPVLGVNMVGVSRMPNANALLTNPQNLIWGIQRNVRVETDKDIRAREVIIVLTARIAIQIEEPDAVVKVTGIAA